MFFCLYSNSQAVCQKRLSGRVESTLLYENNNTTPKFFSVISTIASVQLLFWVYLAYFAFTELEEIDKREKKNKGTDEKQSNGSLPITMMSSSKLRTVVSLVSLGAGLFFAVSAYMYPMRVVHKLSLVRSLQSLEIVTYSPLGKTRALSTPLSDVTCSSSRLTGTKNGVFGLKVRGHAFNYLLDHQVLDSSPNVRLFDRLIATRQKLY